MLKSGLISLLVFILIYIAVHFNIFAWIAGASAKILGIGLVLIVLIVARILLGNPLKNR